MYEKRDVITRKSNGEEVRKNLNEPSDFEKKLTSLGDYLDSKHIIIENNGRDGRKVSQDHEDTVVEYLSKKFSFVMTKDDKPGLYAKLPDRDPGDFYIETEVIVLREDEKSTITKYYPVNLKLVNDNNCNLCGTTKAISTSLYGSFMESNKIAHRMIEEVPFTKNEQQYGFIALHKNTGRVKVFTLFSINEEALTLNKRNGFQFDFNKINPVKRSQEEGQLFVAHCFKDLHKKLAETYTILSNGYVPKYSHTIIKC